MNIYEYFLEILKSFEEEKIEYILIGVFAINLHGFTRATQDLDIFIPRDEENLNRIKLCLFRIFADESVREISFADLTEYSVIRFGTDHGFFVDIISNIGVAFQYNDIEYELVSISGINIRLATAKSLYEMKKNTYREIVQLDIKYLEEKMKRNAH